MQKLITHVALCRRGVRLFTKEVNDHLANGWVVEELSIEKKFLRIVCYAVLGKTKKA